jgi:hypothetical protein
MPIPIRIRQDDAGPIDPDQIRIRIRITVENLQIAQMRKFFSSQKLFFALPQSTKTAFREHVITHF